MQNFQLAGFGKRLVANIIDSIIVWAGFAFLLFAGFYIFGLMTLAVDDLEAIANEIALFAKWALFTGFVLFLFLLILGPVLYETLLTTSSYEGTIGKHLMRIKVVKADGQRLSRGEAFLRALLKYITGMFCFFFFLVCLFNEEQQNLHDRAANAFVVED